MNYYVFTVRWSQTDDEQVIIKADTPEEAKTKVRSIFTGARYFDGGYRPARMIV